MRRSLKSSLSDEELARQLNEESGRHPEEFSEELTSYIDSIPTSKYFIKTTAATAIPTILKGL